MLILASNSPRRKELLALTGWSFTILPVEVDESPLQGEKPADYELAGLPPAERHLLADLFPWIHVGTLRVDIAYAADPLTAVALLVVTGIGGLIHVYAIGYMHDDDAFWRFFAYLNLFTFAMLTLVMGDNLLPSDAQYQTKFKNNPKSYGLLESFPDWYNDPAKIQQRQRQTFVSYNPYFKPKAEPVDAGLIGPVTVRFLVPVQAKLKTEN
jgi:hypothetical protein